MTEENENLRRAQLLVDEAGTKWLISQELAAFIRRPELRRVAETVLALHPSFASTTVLRKLVEADEALGRAIAIHVALEAANDLVPPAADETIPADEAPSDMLMAGRDFPSSETHHGALPRGTLIPRPKETL